jgi:hypothetical protein
MYPLDSTELLELKENIKSSILCNLHDFSLFIINVHIEIYFIIRIIFLDVVHYKTLNTRLDT